MSLMISGLIELLEVSRIGWWAIVCKNISYRVGIKMLIHIPWVFGHIVIVHWQLFTLTHLPTSPLYTSNKLDPIIDSDH